MAKSDVTRTILETTISQALRDMARDPARTMRKLVDLGRHFSHGRFQKHFFALAQTMLAHEDSAYYPLMARVAAQVEHQHLKTFGINLGYNGCTNGAKLIRENEARLGFNIPLSLIHIWLTSNAFWEKVQMDT